MAEPPKFKKDIFVALASIAWADGRLDTDEADAIVRAAVDAGLELDEIESIEAATKERVEIGDIDQSGLSREDRVFVYAMACWIARLDRRVTDEEATALHALGERLGVPERPQALAETLVREVAALPEGDRPARYDLDRLRRLVSEKLSKG
ncbi:hypothetical protein BH09MYX1_BH09MYX1_52900 [soil metagenome]